MNPFILAEEARDTLTNYLRTTFHFSCRPLEEQLFTFLTGPDGMFESSFADLRLPYRKQDPNKQCPLAPDFTPYAHQARAFERLHDKQPSLVVTDTGSGKTVSFPQTCLPVEVRSQGGKLDAPRQAHDLRPEEGTPKHPSGSRPRAAGVDSYP